MKKAKKNIILNNKDKSYDELFKLIQDDEEAKVKALLETRGVRDKLKLLSENNKTGLYDVKLLNFIVDAEPENYVRERVVRGGQAYNPKTDIMKEYTNYLLHQMSKEDYEYTRKLLSDESKTYYVKISVVYHLPIPKNDSAYKTVLKATGAVMHDKTPDIDNYDKFIIDCLHNVVYDNDKRLIYINSSKKYSLHPRTELSVSILELKEEL